MKRLSLPLLRSKTVIQADILPSFSCVIRCHTSSLKCKFRNLLSSNSLARAQLPAQWLANPNVHWLITPEKLPTPALPKRLSLIFIWAELSRRARIPIFNILLNTVCIVGGRQGTHSYLPLPKNYKEKVFFRSRLLSLC